MGELKVHKCSATLGASRTATAQAEGGFMIKDPWPEIRNLLFEALSQAKTLSGRNCVSLLKYSSICRVPSDLTVMLPSTSTRRTPWLAKIESLVLTPSVAVLIVKPKGYPALKHFSAAVRKYSQVQLSMSR